MDRMNSGAEWKYIDQNQSGISTSTTFQQFLLNGCASGTGPSQRVGRTISLRSIQLQLRLIAQSGMTLTSGCTVRFIIFYDKQANATAPGVAAGDLLEQVTVVSPRGLDKRKRFKILADRRYTFATWGAGDLSDQFDTFFIKFRKPLLVNYNAGNVGDVTDIVTNSLWAGILGTGGATFNPTGHFYSRVRYTDN